MKKPKLVPVPKFHKKAMKTLRMTKPKQKKARTRQAEKKLAELILFIGQLPAPDQSDCRELQEKFQPLMKWAQKRGGS